MIFKTIEKRVLKLWCYCKVILDNYNESYDTLLSDPSYLHKPRWFWPSKSLMLWGRITNYKKKKLMTLCVTNSSSCSWFLIFFISISLSLSSKQPVIFWNFVTNNNKQVYLYHNYLGGIYKRHGNETGTIDIRIYTCYISLLPLLGYLKDYWHFCNRCNASARKHNSSFKNLYLFPICILHLTLG